MIDLKNEFINPSKEYTPIPFWFWNDDLNEAELERQIFDFKSKVVDDLIFHND